jgi:hypothetical protein
MDADSQQTETVPSSALPAISNSLSNEQCKLSDKIMSLYVLISEHDCHVRMNRNCTARSMPILRQIRVYDGRS